MLSALIVNLFWTLSKLTKALPVPTNLTISLESTDVVTLLSPTLHPLYVGGIAAQDVFCPSVVRYLLEFAACDGKNAFKASLALVVPVPPYAIPIVCASHLPADRTPTDSKLDALIIFPSPVLVMTSSPLIL